MHEFFTFLHASYGVQGIIHFSPLPRLRGRGMGDGAPHRGQSRTMEKNLASQDITLRKEHMDRLKSLINQDVAGERY